MIDELTGPENSNGSSKRPELLLVFFLAVFFLVGLSLVPYPGIQNDEALFSAGVYAPEHTISVLSVFKRRIPMMLMNYLGAFKAWLYAPILAVWKPSVYSVRVPVLLAGAATIWLFYLLLRRVSGRRAALIGSALLAADTTFVLTTCFDWGPVALQHLLLVGGLLLLVRFHQGGSRVALCAAFFLFGLALWDKALFGWTLIGLVTGALCAFPRMFLRAFSVRNVALAVCWFSIGAFPLLRHNVQRRMETFQANVGYTTEGIRGKAHVLRSSLDGSGLFAYIAYDDPVERTAPPRTPLERLSVALNEFAGRPRHSPMPYVLLGALLMLPLLWFTSARRPMLFALVCSAVVWAQMLFAMGAGGSVHHAVLLWPWPHFFVAVAFAEASTRLRKPGTVLVTVAVAWIGVSNLLVTNQYRAQLIRNGGAGSWTDATWPLHSYLETLNARQIFIIDWGMVDTLRLLGEGRLPMRWGTEPLLRESLGETEVREFREMAENRDDVFVSHTDDQEVFVGVNARLRTLSEQAGFRRDPLRTIHDRNGRPIFEVFRFRQREAGAASP